MPTLETVKVEDAVSPEERTAPTALVRSILRAIRQNTAIQSVELKWLRLPTDISTFVDNASSITSFRLYKCDGEQGARSLAAALQRNKSIETLRLGRLEDIYAVPILEVLGSNVSLKTLIFSPTTTNIISDAASHALQHLLESTTSIRQFELRVADFRNEQLFRPIAQGIINSECVSELKLFDCRFHDSGSFAQLQSILQNKRNLTSLCLNECRFGGGQVHEDIISIVSRPDSLLRCFEFQNAWSGYPWEVVFPRIPFEALLRAIKKSKLKRFQIGNMETLDYLPVLTQSIPSMKLKELELKFWVDEDRDDEDSDDEDEPEGEFNREAIRQDLLHAVKNNFSLVSVKAELSGTDLFDNGGKQTLAFYANRNESLDQWVDNPETIVDRKVWPNALGLAERAGPDALFRSLRSVLESEEYMIPKGGRKRRRPL